MSSMWGERIKISVFGESHGPAIGVVIDGLPGGEEIDLTAVAAQMARRAPGRDRTATARKEDDLPEILSGFLGRQNHRRAVVRRHPQHQHPFGRLLRAVRQAPPFPRRLHRPPALRGGDRSARRRTFFRPS